MYQKQKSTAITITTVLFFVYVNLTKIDYFFTATFLPSTIYTPLSVILFNF
jgi:hypothetical protein